jgi:small GTP-binding protein
MEKTVLRVQPAKKRDIGRNIARFDQEIMEKLGLKTGDIVSLIGNKESAGLAWPSYPQDSGLGIIRIDSRFMKNTGTSINDDIELQKIVIQSAKSVVLAPIRVKIKTNPRFEVFVKRKLKNYPVTIDDFIRISIGIRREIMFQVINISPKGVCIINQETTIHISEDIIEDDILDDIQLQNLEVFLKKCNYNKEELVSEIEKEINIGQDWIKVSNVNMKHLIAYLLQKNDLNWLISKIAIDLYNKYDKAISQGQVEAVLRRVLGLPLSSTGRSHLNELRKKIRKYEKFLRHFGEWDTYDFTFKFVIMGLNPDQVTKLIKIPPLKETSGSGLIKGGEYYLKPIEISDKRVKLQLWNVSTKKKFQFLIQQYCEGANGAIICYDKGDRESFESAKESYNEFKEATDLKYELKERRGTFIDVPIILIGFGGGKKVTSEEGQSLVKKWGAYGYIEMEEINSQNFEINLSSLSLGIITNYQNILKKYPHEYGFKIIVVGDVQVGKTSLIEKYTRGSFNKDYIKTIGAQYSVYEKELEEDKITCFFWDIAGSKEFHFLRPRFFKNSHAAIIVYSLGENDLGRESVNQISNWYNEIMKHCPEIPIIIIANKSDLVDDTKLDYSYIQEFINENKLLGFFITSVKNNQGINRAFDSIIEALYNKFKKSV